MSGAARVSAALAAQGMAAGALEAAAPQPARAPGLAATPVSSPAARAWMAQAELAAARSALMEEERRGGARARDADPRAGARPDPAAPAAARPCAARAPIPAARPEAGGALRPAALSGGGRIYATRVMHQRLSPRRHGFSYRAWTLLLDVDRIEESLAPLRWAGTGRFAPIAHRDADHGPRDGTPLRPWAEAQLARVGLPAPAHIGLLALPRIFGRAFNPLSLHYCWDEAARLIAVIAEVKNTFGDQHAYVLRAPEPGARMLRAGKDKHFFVSPFMDMDQRYRFDLGEPGETLRIRIRQGAPGGPDRFIAAQTGAALPLDDSGLRRIALGTPLHGLKAPLAIHWEALRLALKGVPFLGHPGDAAVYAPGADRPGG